MLIISPTKLTDESLAPDNSRLTLLPLPSYNLREYVLGLHIGICAHTGRLLWPAAIQRSKRPEPK